MILLKLRNQTMSEWCGDPRCRAVHFTYVEMHPNSVFPTSFRCSVNQICHNSAPMNDFVGFYEVEYLRHILTQADLEQNKNTSATFLSSWHGKRQD